jgi:hypothetical protein
LRRKRYTEIEVEFDDLEPATKFGPEFLTYVLWAISPRGPGVKPGEILLVEPPMASSTTTNRAFGMIVTAEPCCGDTAVTSS